MTYVAGALAAHLIASRLTTSGRQPGTSMTDDLPSEQALKAADFAAGVSRYTSRLVQHDTVVLLVDLVESVRLMQENEADAVLRWASFVHRVSSDVLPRHDG